jgi:hypothetical protein
MLKIKPKNLIKYFSILYAFITANALYIYAKMGGIYIKGSVFLGVNDPNAHSFRLKVPTLSADNLFFTSQNNFSMVVTWMECTREPYIMLYILFATLPYILFFIQLYYFYKIAEKIEKNDYSIDKLIQKIILSIAAGYLVQEFLIPIGEQCKIAFFQKHIYFEDSLWHNSVFMEKSSSLNFLHLTFFALFGILFTVYKKREIPIQENDSLA